MKIRDPFISAFSLLILISLTGAIAGCFWKGDEVKFSKVSDPEAVSASCSQKMGFDPDLTKLLSEAFKDYDGELNDEFKLKAMALVTESPSVPAEQRNDVIKEYFSCLAGSSEKK